MTEEEHQELIWKLARDSFTVNLGLGGSDKFRWVKARAAELLAAGELTRGQAHSLPYSVSGIRTVLLTAHSRRRDAVRDPTHPAGYRLVDLPPDRAH